MVPTFTFGGRGAAPGRLTVAQLAVVGAAPAAPIIYRGARLVWRFLVGDSLQEIGENIFLNELARLEKEQREKQGRFFLQIMLDGHILDSAGNVVGWMTPGWFTDP